MCYHSSRFRSRLLTNQGYLSGTSDEGSEVAARVFAADLRFSEGEYHPENDELPGISRLRGLESRNVGSSRLQRVRTRDYAAGFIEANRLLAKRIRIRVYAIDDVY